VATIPPILSKVFIAILPSLAKPSADPSVLSAVLCHRARKCNAPTQEALP
jgi:hypothetical protein